MDTKMWGGGGLDEGGGFYNDSMQSSPGKEKQGKKVTKAQNCIPVTIQQIIGSTEDEFKFGNAEVHMVCVVGLLRKMEEDSTKATYLLDDHTGQLNAFVFNTDNAESNPLKKTFELNQYHRVYGSVRVSNKQRHVMVFHMEPLLSLEELTAHLLEVMYAPLSLEEQDTQQTGQRTMDSSSMNTNNQNGNMFNDSMDVGQAVVSGLNPQQNVVHSLIRSCTDNNGLSRDEIASTLQSKINGKEIDKIIDFLINEGHLYTTLDDQHFKTTD